MAVKSSHCLVKSIASVSIVTDFDFALRKKVADLIHEGIDWHFAMQVARGNDTAMKLNFLSLITISVAETVAWPPLSQVCASREGPPLDPNVPRRSRTPRSLSS